MKGPDLTRWPLLGTGLAVLYTATFLPDDAAGSSARSLMLGVGAMLTGAGVVLVSWGHADPLRWHEHPERHADDPPGSGQDARPSTYDAADTTDRPDG